MPQPHERKVRYDAQGDLWRKALEGSLSAFDAEGRLVVDKGGVVEETEVERLRRQLACALRINEALSRELERVLAKGASE